MRTFSCSRCGETKPVMVDGGTGYARMDDAFVCYACCAVLDREHMIEHGRISLYLTDRGIVNWPGTLVFPHGPVRKGSHNFARRQYTTYFRGPDGKTWLARQCGDNTQICHCRRTKT